MELVEAVTLDQNVLDLVLVVFHRIHAHGIKGRTCGVNGKVIVAVDTCDLLNDVGVDGHILCGAPRGYGHVKGVSVQRYGEAEAVKGFENGVVADLNACVAVNKRLVKAELYRVVTESVLVGESGNHLYAAVVLLEQIQKTGDGCVAHLGVKALFIAHGRVGAV